MSGVSGEPYFGRGIETLPPEVYSEMAGESAVATLKVEDKAFIEATTTVVKDLHQQGNVVILGRGANVILADTPGVIHVGLLAPLEVRAQTMMEREHLDLEEAEEYAEELERARVAFFRKFFKVHPNDPTLYHIMLNMGKVERQIAAGIHGLVPVGTTGETATLSHEEHHRVVELCVEVSAGRVPVIAGAGSNSTAEAI